jgi:photosystem II stability/assembly factor-like uncharacterized protein
MALIAGTRDGVWLADPDAGADPERVCDAGKVYDVAPTGDGWLAAAGSGLYRGDASGKDWDRLDVVEAPLTAAGATPDGERLFAGTRTAGLFASDDGGATWAELDGFASLPSRDHWWNPDVPAHVRALETHPSAPDRVVAGVDGGGVHVSDDRGGTWSERCTAVSAFVHDLCALGPDEWVAATDAGLFRTRDGGEWWDYLYDDDMYHRYFRGVFADGHVVYSGGARSHPPVWTGELGADAALYRLDLSARDPDLTREPYPAEPRDVVLSGTLLDGVPVAGTHEGRLLSRVGGSWETLARLPEGPQVRVVHPL